MKRPDLSTVAIVLVLLALLVPTSASPGDDIDNSGIVIVPSNTANGAYAQLDQNGELAITLDGSTIPTGGSGVNPNAETVFQDVFRVTNQGSEGVAIWTDDQIDEVTFQHDGTKRSIEDPADCIYLAPGDAQTVGVTVRSGEESGTLSKSFTVRARLAVPEDCPSTTTPTPGTPTPSTPTATPTTPSTPESGGGGGGGPSGPPAEPGEPTGEGPTTPGPEPGGATAAFSAVPSGNIVCGPVRFDARSAGDGEPEITRYQWSFPEGNATGQSVRHTFEKPGEATVSLTVEDAGGQVDTTTQTVLVNDRPAVKVIVPADAKSGEEVELMANVTDRYGDIRGVYWRFQDGSTKAGQTVTHAFPDPTQSVEVIAVDSCGAKGRTTASIRTASRGPVETAVDAVGSGIPFLVRTAAVVVLAPLLFALDRRRKGRRRRRR
jgi:PKD repeat protein